MHSIFHTQPSLLKYIKHGTKYLQYMVLFKLASYHDALIKLASYHDALIKLASYHDALIKLASYYGALIISFFFLTISCLLKHRNVVK